MTDEQSCVLCDGTGLVEDPSACGDPEHCYGWMPCPAGCPDETRSLIQGFARTRQNAFPDGCPWGEPPGCRCANCYTG